MTPMMVMTIMISYFGGICETTMTDRSLVLCDCPTYTSNLGVCRGYEEGKNSRCVFCDHDEKCHGFVDDEENDTDT